MAGAISYRRSSPPGIGWSRSDNRGFGFSDKPAHGYTNAAYAHLVVSLLDSLGISSAVLIGHSMGGAIAAEVALRYPDRVRGLCDRRRRLRRALARRSQIGALAAGGRGGHEVSGALDYARILRSTFADPSKVTEADVDQYYAPVPDPAYGRALRGVLREFRSTAWAVALAGVQAPTLILWGDGDRWIPLRDGTRFTQELPRSEFVVLTRTGHDAADESPDLVNRYLLAYLKEGLSRIRRTSQWRQRTIDLRLYQPNG